MLGSQRSHSHDKTDSGFVDSSEGVGRKGRISSTTDRYRAGILDGHRDWQIRRSYGFRGTVTAGDGSNQKGGKMRARYVNLQKQRKRQQRKVGREEEGSSSNRLELVAFVLALRGTPVTNVHASFVRPPSAADSCEKMDRRRRKSTVSRSARRRHFMGSSQRAPEKEQRRRFWSR